MSDVTMKVRMSPTQAGRLLQAKWNLEKEVERLKSDPAFFGLYKITTRGHYDGFGKTRSETLLATANDPQSLKDRWNAKQKEQCLDYGYRHESYFSRIDPPFREGDEIRYNGSTGGGCASVSHVVVIQKVPQWDEG